MIAEPLPIGVLRNPISPGEPRFDRPLQSSKSLVFLAKDREYTALDVETRVVIGCQRHSSLIPLLSTLDFPKPCKNYRTQVESARLIGVELQVFVYRLDCELVGALRLIVPPHSPQHLTD